jgi:hypothetical protein
MKEDLEVDEREPVVDDEPDVPRFSPSPPLTEVAAWQTLYGRRTKWGATWSLNWWA